MNKFNVEFDMEEKYLYNFLNNLNEAVYVNFKGKTIFCNEVALEYLKIKKGDEGAEKEAENLLDNTDFIQELMSQIVKMNPHSKNDVIRKRLIYDNSVLDVEVFVNFMPYKDDFARICMIRKHAIEDKTILSKEKYKKLLKFLPLGVFMVKDDVIEFVNETGARLLGFDVVNNVLDRDIKNFINKDFLNEFEKMKNRVLLNNEEVKGVIQKIDKINEGYRYIEMGCTYLSYMGSKHLLITAKDITERVETKEKYERLLELSKDAIYITRANEFLYANKEGIKLLGEAEEDIIGKNYFDYTHKDYADSVRERMKKVYLNKEYELTTEIKIVNRKGKTFDVELSNTALEIDGEIIAFHIIRDITEKKRAQKEAVRSKRLLSEAKEFDNLRTEFFANLSHEFKTPLNVILGSVQILEMYSEKKHILHNNEEKLKKHVSIMRQNCNRILRLVNNLIDITKIDSGFLEVNLKNCDVINIIEEIVLSVVDYAQIKGVNLTFDTEIEELIIACDSDKIERIFLNLLSNALKFTKLGDEIFVNITGEDDFLLISVKDTGIGIPEDKLEIIFDRFRQVDKSFTRNHEGSGIGLSLVKSLVELHGGRVEVRSEYGVGSEFIVKIPLNYLTVEYNRNSNYNYKQEKIERLRVEFSDIYS